MDGVLKRLTELEWVYGDGDAAARVTLLQRIDAVGPMDDGFLTYSELVDGVTFRLANVVGGKPFEITEWTNLNRAILGSFLGRIVVDSYREGQFFASALSRSQ